MWRCGVQFSCIWEAAGALWSLSDRQRTTKFNDFCGWVRLGVIPGAILQRGGLDRGFFAGFVDLRTQSQGSLRSASIWWFVFSELALLGVYKHKRIENNIKP